MLRVETVLVPFGIEDNKRTIGILSLSNTGQEIASGTFLYKYGYKEMQERKIPRKSFIIPNEIGEGIFIDIDKTLIEILDFSEIQPNDFVVRGEITHFREDGVAKLLSLIYEDIAKKVKELKNKDGC